MGGMTDQAYEDANNEAEQAWLRSLPLKERIWVEVSRAASIAGFFLIVSGVIGVVISR